MRLGFRHALIAAAVAAVLALPGTAYGFSAWGTAQKIDTIGGNSSGSYTVNSGGAINFTTGTYNFSGGTVSGAGSLNITGATMNVAGAVSASGLSMSGGTLTGTGNVTVTDRLIWTGGTMSGSGQSSIEYCGVTSTTPRLETGARVSATV